MGLRFHHLGKGPVRTFDAGFKGLGELWRRDLHQLLERQTVFRLPGVPCVMEPDLRRESDQPVIALAVLFHLRLRLQVEIALGDDLIDLDIKSDVPFAVIRTLNNQVKVISLVLHEGTVGQADEAPA